MWKWRPQNQTKKDDLWNQANYRGKRTNPFLSFALISGKNLVLFILFVLLVIVVGINWFFPVVGKRALTGYLIASIGKIIIAIGCIYIFIIQLIKIIKSRRSQYPGWGRPWFRFWINIIVCVFLPIIGVSQAMQAAVAIDNYSVDSKLNPIFREVDCIAIQQNPSSLRVFHYRKPHLLLKADNEEPFLAEIDVRIARSIQGQIHSGLLPRGENGYIRLAVEYYPNYKVLYSIDYPGGKFLKLNNGITFIS